MIADSYCSSQSSQSSVEMEVSQEKETPSSRKRSQSHQIESTPAKKASLSLSNNKVCLFTFDIYNKARESTIPLTEGLMEREVLQSPKSWMVLFI